MPLELLLAGALLAALILFKGRTRHESAIWFDGVILRPEDLAAHARGLGKFHRVVRVRRSCRLIIRRLEDNFRFITRIYQETADDLHQGKQVAPAGEWLLDNYYIVEEQVKEILLSVRGRRFQDLPVLTNGQFKGSPRIYALALELISHTDGSLSEQALDRFVEAYQEEAPLDISEIWSLALMVRIALLEKIRHTCHSLAATHKQWRLAELFLARTKPGKLDERIGAQGKLDFAFAEHLLAVIRHNEPAAKQVRDLLGEKLLEQDISLEKLVHSEHQGKAAQTTSMSNAVLSLKSASTLDWDSIFEKLSLVNRILGADEVYREMDFDSRNHYRRQVQLLARKLGTRETRVAKLALAKAREEEGYRGHCGYYLIAEGRRDLFAPWGLKSGAKMSGSLYIALNLALSLALGGAVAAAAFPLGRGWALILGLAFLIPGSEGVVALVNHLLVFLRRPAFLPKLEYRQGLPPDAATLVVVPALLPDVRRTEELIRQLEVHYLANREENLFFALLGDFKDASQENVPGDQEILAAAQRGIQSLNDSYRGNRFFALVRGRGFSQTQGKWLGWERKRGALVELNALFSGGKDTSFLLKPSSLPRVRYILTLDADTRLPLAGAKKLVGTISHPLNRLVLDPENRPLRGYGLIQPRITISIESINKSAFARVMAGPGGTDTYTTAVSDVYQDWFGRGIFTGKGIYDLAAAQRLLKIVPENSILSHDLLEGGLLSTGLATDLVLVDDFPARYSSYTARSHRWTRGDWQLLPWLGGRVAGRENPLTAISRWQILDNLRRSLGPVAQMVFLLASLLAPGGKWLGLLLFLASLLAPSLFSLLGFARRARRGGTGDLGRWLGRLGWQLAFLPHQAWTNGEAIGRTVYRLFISRKNLLEWTTAAEAEKMAGDNYRRLFRPALLATAAYLLPLAIFRPSALVIYLPLLALWLYSPALARRISRAPAAEDEPTLEDKALLRRLAQKTWLYYEKLVGEDTSHLPPDNFQAKPPTGSDYRTSPTNIGFYLLALLAARDFGFITASTLAARLDKALTSIEKLEKWKGHLYNWYDIRDLELLRPRFISTVDSGNFCCLLVAVGQGLREYLRGPLFDDSPARGVGEAAGQDGLAPEGEKGDRADWLAAPEKGQSPGGQELLADLEGLAARVEALVAATDFAALYNSQRNLFSIGYSVDEEKLIESNYDLLASEARLTSYLAIVLGQVPAKHWQQLGRAQVRVGRDKALVSWSGTMFEYLMPQLLLKEYPKTLLAQTTAAVITAQRRYGEKGNIPWGVSESGYYAFDYRLNYQYRAFGIPSLGLKRGLVDDLVVSPYSTLLALPFAPQAALANLRRLLEEGMEGEYGLYEAVDYTPDRAAEEGHQAVVQSYFAHHQGMGLISLANYLNGGVMVRRFHQDPRVVAGELLLQEIPSRQPVLSRLVREPARRPSAEGEKEGEVVRSFGRPGRQPPNCHLLSNGSYTVLLTDSGGGYSRNENVAISRWRELQGYKRGTFIFIRSLNTDQVWSATLAPFREAPDFYRVRFFPDRASYFREMANIDTKTEVVVSTEDNAEVRRVSLTNHGLKEASLEVTSFFELALSHQDADLAHPAFNNLFIETEALPEYHCLLAFRRPRGEKDPCYYALHQVTVEGESIGPVQFETDRSKFIGRGRDISCPVALRQPLTNTSGRVLDPAMSLRRQIKLGPGQSAVLTFTTAQGASRGEMVKLAAKYSDPAAGQRALDMAYTRSQVERRFLNLSPELLRASQQAVGHLVFASPTRRRYQQVLAKNTLGQQSLWAHGISGDNPIVLLSVRDTEDVGIIEETILAHEYWRFKGLVVDLVILHGGEGGYHEPVRDLVRDLVQLFRITDILDKPGGIYIRSSRQLGPGEKYLFHGAARLILSQGTLAEQLEAEEGALPLVQEFRGKDWDIAPRPQPEELLFTNGLGGFTPGGDQYVIQLQQRMTPAPWVNVLANPDFGCIVSERGGGYVFAENSRENKLTPWSNDPVSDPAGEVIYLRDEDSGAVWTVCPAPILESQPYTIRHGQGYSVFSHHSHGLAQELQVFVPPEDPVKLSALRVWNDSPQERRLTLTYFVRPVLGVSEERTHLHLVSRRLGDLLTFTNPYNSDFPGRLLWLGASRPPMGLTGDCEEFLGLEGDLAAPAALTRRGLSNATGPGLNPCAALQVALTLAPGEEGETVFLLGHSKSPDGAQKMAAKYRSGAGAALEQTKEYWRNLTGAIRVKTPETSLDILLSWLLYQTLVSRLWARTGFYQCGGAFGFRDQLQDAANLSLVAPALARKQILLHAAHQFLEGDVQHWWHPGTNNRGVRTRFSDDLLWLPWTVADYVERTGDRSILVEMVPFLRGKLLAPGIDEFYGEAQATEERGSIYDHCRRALARALNFGSHGLPLMGSGDWNDGMSNVGREGRGESIWLGWFLYDILRRFAPLSRDQGDEAGAAEYLKIAEAIRQALEKNGWDGRWYRRAYFDDGTPLGSAENPECTIDSLPQSWAVISGGGRPDRVEEAMGEVETHLVREDEGLILLFTPPFDSSSLRPGYIKGYVPGVRENGGQYTHAACWAIQAQARLGRGGKALDWAQLINPIHHSRTPIESFRYKVEPYVLAADVYAAAAHRGQGGWTWYTGAAGWLYLVLVEDILGLKRRGSVLEIDPCLPEHWREYSLDYRFGSSTYRITVHNPKGLSRGTAKITVDGVPRREVRLEAGGGTRTVRVELE